MLQDIEVTFIKLGNHSKGQGECEEWQPSDEADTQDVEGWSDSKNAGPKMLKHSRGPRLRRMGGC